VTGAILLLGGDDASTSSPQDTVDSFVQAMADADCEAIESLVTDRYLEAAPDCDPKALEQTFGDADIETPEITEESDESAVAEMSEAGGTFQMVLVNEDGSWLIDEITAGSSAPISPPDADGSGGADDSEGQALDPELPDAADAQAMVESYVEALQARDCATVTSLSSQMLRSSTSCVSGLLPPAGVDVAFGRPTVVSTTVARVPVTIDGRKSTATLMLTQEDDQWKVSQVDIT
jgi:hypothetical protein